jgi:hypothetical protein
MKKLVLYLTPLLLAFAVMVVVNEYSRITVDEGIKNKIGLMKINSEVITPDACTWHCHNDTNYCKKHHVSWMKNYLAFIDPFYSGIITLLGITGSYVLANLIFLVILWPLLMSYLLVKSIRVQQQISLSKQ